ncbi:hypothetical protein PHYSODRAFT_259794 [Phytophthora sojae]|uniref:Myb-like domain-containing protein n=1 Tax=Phytophthora sojae (strain P6497) TaxID=1094619 RepID=G5A048_PHYSP|nr:hypothetical protein PHYSODRAFT_259794 [Phytophthora sojae]EGZ11291.1 hypothetical protein PHYSODRAFT_259794 [Phytophthora sojae]|eukprot:XP_009534036.1 hypothetical protein PHYSODRAFT_259794 [Phytophthora sojae]
MAAIAPARASTNFSVETHSSSTDSAMMMLTSPTATSSTATPTISTKPITGKRAVGVWSSEEHDRFLEALKKVYGMQTGKAIRLRREHRIDHDILALHTLISFPPELRHKRVRRSHPSEAKRAPVVTSVEPPAPGVKTPEFQCPTIDLIDKDFCPITDSDDASSSSVSSSFLFDDSVFALVDADDLPTLSELLDFFIENLSLY